MCKLILDGFCDLKFIAFSFLCSYYVPLSEPVCHFISIATRCHIIWPATNSIIYTYTQYELQVRTSIQRTNSMPANFRRQNCFIYFTTYYVLGETWHSILFFSVFVFRPFPISVGDFVRGSLWGFLCDVFFLFRWLRSFELAGHAFEG